MISIGILGLGEGRCAMSAALKSSRIDLKMICDANPEMGKIRSSEFGFNRLNGCLAD